MKESSLAHLVCPYCGNGLEARFRSPASGREIESAILACACSEFPLVGGIPIFQRTGTVDLMRQTVDSPLVRGPEVSRLLELLRAGSGEEALALLVPPARPAGSRGLLERLGGGSRASRSDSPSTARDALEAYARQSGKAEHFFHFYHRFAQPRHMSSLAAAWILPDGPGASLDLACGFGHTLHSWTSKRPSATFYGVDRNFVSLYVARRWVAPRADYVCTRGDDRLPFADGFFSAILCADAFHCFSRKKAAVEDFRRLLAPEGAVALSRFGNARVEPREGEELDPEGYARLFESFRVRLSPESEFLRRYVSGRLPDLSAADGPGPVANAKWLTLVAARSEEPFRDYGPLGDWPHGLGRLRLNPLYRTRPRPDGVSLALEFPTPWFESENAECLAYMPKTIDLPRGTLDDVEAQRRTPEVERLIGCGVVLGFPEAYG